MKLLIGSKKAQLVNVNLAIMNLTLEQVLVVKNVTSAVWNVQ